MRPYSITSPEFKQHFLSKTIYTATGCLEWQCGKNSEGYGKIFVSSATQAAHRVAWIIANGPIPDGLLVLHKCDNPPCCNVDHLFLGTNADNVHDCQAKGRKSCRQKKLTESQVAEIRTIYKRGSRDCSIRALASRYGVGRSEVCRIVNYQRWKNAL